MKYDKAQNFLAAIRRRVETLMTDETRGRSKMLAGGLYFVSLLFTLAVRCNAWMYRARWRRTRRIPCRVISIGNLVVGGTGKTPLTIFVARMLQQQHMRVAVICRGYKGTAEKKGGIVCDGRSILMEAAAAGDEPFLIASKLGDIPVLVGQNRYRVGLRAIEEFDVEAVVLDDAFQHLALFRDIDLVLADQQDPVGNGHLLPRGVLREPPSALQRADALILTGSLPCDSFDPEKSRAVFGKTLETIPVFTSNRIASYTEIGGQKPATVIRLSESTAVNDVTELRGRRVYAFAGLADCRRFRGSLEKLQIEVAGFADFPDHHWYSQADLKRIVHNAKQCKAECLLTTEKDYVRLANQYRWPQPLIVMGIRMTFGEEEQAFKNFLMDRLKKAGGQMGNS